MQDAAAVSTERLPVELERPLAALTVCAVATQLREAEKLDTTASQGLTKWLLRQRVSGREREAADAASVWASGREG